MISSKFNFIVGAAILASTVYLLWIKIKRKSNSHHKNDNEIFKNNNDEFSKSQLEPLESCTDSNFLVTEEIENFEMNNKDELDSLLDDKYTCINIDDSEVTDIYEVKKHDSENKIDACLTNQVQINEYKKEETLHLNELPCNMSTSNNDILSERIDANVILEISNNTHNLSTIKAEVCGELVNTEETYMKSIEETNPNCFDGLGIVNEFLPNKNQINMSLEDGEIIEESLENSKENATNEIEALHIETEKAISDVVEALIEIKNDIILTEIEDGEIIEESFIENEFEAVLHEKCKIIINENIKDKDLEHVKISTQIIIKSESEVINEIHVDGKIQTESTKQLDEIEEGEIIEESFVQNEIECSNYQKDKDIKESSDEFDTKQLEEIEEGEIIEESFVQNEIECSNYQKDKDIKANADECDMSTFSDRLYIENIASDKKQPNSLQNNIQNELLIANKDITQNTFEEENLIKNILVKDENCNIEVIEKCNEDINRESIENSSVLNNDVEEIRESNNNEENKLIDEDCEEMLINIDIQAKEDYSEMNETNIEKDGSIDNIADDTKNEEILNTIVDGNVLIDNMKNENFENEVEYPEIEAIEVGKNLINYECNDDESTSDLSQNSDYLGDAPLDNFMNYIDECLNGNDTKNEESESNCKLENWPNDEDSLNNIKRDFYEINTAICSPHPSSESDHAHCVNNLTERVAILSAESILDNQYQVNSSDSEMTPTLSSPTLDDSNPELYVEKITCGGKELDVVYFEEALLEEGGVQSDIKIVRTIPVGLGGRIIGKKGKTKNELLKKYGAQLLIYNHPMEIGKQVLEITCNPSVSGQLENWVNKTLDQITKNTIQTTVSNPEWLKPMIPLGRLVAAHVVDMSTIQHIKLRIFDQEIIKAFNTMQNEMNIDYSNADNTSLLPRPVAAGCVCVAMIRPDYFLRAQIVEIYDDFAWVYLFDLGKVCQTYLCYLFKIREKYMRVPFQVIPARMPHALIKNKNISPAIIYKRFLCDQNTNKPKMVRVFFPRMNTCCEPCVNIYIPMSIVSDNGHNNEEFVDLLELLVSIDVCSMVRETVNSDIQVKINSSHFKAFLNGKDKKQSVNSNVPVYFQPCNSKFYDDFIEFKSEKETN